MGSFTCHSCTFINENTSALACSLCGAARSTASAAGWRCSGCTLQNAAESRACHACGQQRGHAGDDAGAEEGAEQQEADPVYARLSEARTLLRRGLITQEDFERVKTAAVGALLPPTPSHAPAAADAPEAAAATPLDLAAVNSRLRDALAQRREPGEVFQLLRRLSGVEVTEGQLRDTGLHDSFTAP